MIGCEVYVSQQGHKTRSDTDRYNHLVLLCENQEGYRNLINLVSTGYLEGFYYKPRIDKDLLARHSKGLIAMSACLRGDINETLLADRYDDARRLALHLRGHLRPRATSSSRSRTTAWSRTSASLPQRQPALAGDRASRWSPPTTRTTCAGKTRARTKSCSASRPARP